MEKPLDTGSKNENLHIMEITRLLFTIDIKAAQNKIWKALWSDSGYRSWAGIFFEGSYAISDNWEIGSTVLFLSPDQSGIYSIIETHIPNKTIQFRHIGSVLEGKEQPVDDESKKWSGATESYTLTEGSDAITLTVEIDVLDEHLDFMSKTFPKAMEKMKLLSED